MTIDKGNPTEPTAAAEPVTAEAQPPNGEGEERVPYDRFQAINQQKNELAKRLEDLELAEQERQAKAKEAAEKQLKEQQKFAELADQYKAELETTTATAVQAKATIEKYEAVLIALYEARKTAVPEMYQPLLDNLDLAARLEWIAANEDKLKPANGSNGIPPTPAPRGVGTISDDERRRKAARVW